MKFTDLSKALARPQDVTELDLHRQPEVRELPEAIGKMTRLRKFGVSECPVRRIPDSLAGLPIEDLTCHETRSRRSPKSSASCPS